MLAKRVIPCLDVTDGRVVKGVNFVDLVDAGDPVEVALKYDQSLADELAFLDITATSDGRRTMVNIVEKVAEKIFIPLTVGGGIRSLDDITLMLHSGADKVSINSAAISNSSLINKASDKFGSQCIVVAIDAKAKFINGEKFWEVYTHGGRVATGINALEWAIEVADRGAGEILLTSMDRDGTRSGYDIELTNRISSSVNIPVIASGGAGTPYDLYRVFTLGKADAVLAASIFHFGNYSIIDIKRYLYDKGINVRI